ncbi:hypothetical protein CRE_18166 [Caenorhabditis remanei]|uniref:PAN-3 domain-containing protein n=1 Tax=Caenorhabditis remanei TaxID=31234 RepID=E3N8L2_CAERE|nr:hypothetical protein CRE_18166 [Caenorhabditis remanei]
MLKIFGKVSNVSLNSIMVDINCMNTCFTQDDCFLAYFNSQDHCQLFSFNATESLEVEKTTKADGFYVAFKTTLPNNTCPAYDSMIPVVNIGEDPVSWKRSGNTFSFQKCRGDWKMFRRTNPNITVCMKPFLLPKRGNLTEGKGFCEKMGYKLSGVASVEETQWILEQMILTGISLKNWETFYIDGIRTQNCSLTRCNEFELSDGYTVIDDAALSSTNADLSFIDKNQNREDCLGVVARYSGRINDVRCDSADLNVGVVCGYKLF